MDQSSDGATRGIPRLIAILAVGAAFTIAMAGVRSVGDIVGPAFLALVLTITLHPLRRRLQRLGIPDLVASGILLITTYILLAALAFALVISAAQVATLVADYTPELSEQFDSLSRFLDRLGVSDDQVAAVLSTLDPSRLIGLVGNVFSGAFGLVSGIAFIATLLLFMTFDSTKIIQVLGTLQGRRSNLVDALISFGNGTRTYMAVSAVFGLIVAVIDTVVLALMGIPGAFVWGLLAFVTNFIPNIGFVIGLVPPALLALLDGGLDQMVLVIAAYAVINFIIQSIIQPKFVSDAVGLTTTVTLIALVFWAWLLGPLGALLAVPLTLLVRAVLIEADPSARWALPLISGRADATQDVESGPMRR